MALFSSKKRVLIAGNEGVTLFGPTADGGIEHEISISWEVPNFGQQLADALSSQNKNCSVLVFYDADHTYRKEEGIPKLSFFDRPRFVKRKLDQAFLSYPIRAYLEVKAPKREGGGKDRPSYYLFVAIPETDRLDKIAAGILAAGVPVSGLGLLPVESEGLVTALSKKLFGGKGKKSRWAVLIGQQETGGLRQVVVKDDHMILTRMTPVSEAGIQGSAWVDWVMHEFRATLTYIARLGYTPAEGLDVIVIGGDAEKQFFDQQKSLPGNNFQCLKITDALQAIGSNGSLLEKNNFSDALPAAWASKKRFLTVPVKAPSIYNIMMPRLWARVASVVMVLSLIGIAGFTFSVYQDYSTLQEGIGQKQSQKIFLNKEYEQESKVFDGLPVKPSVVRGTLAVKKSLDDSSFNVTPTLNLLRKALDRDIKLAELSFEYSPPVVQKPGIGGAFAQANSSPGNRGSVKIVFKFSLIGNLPLEQKVARTEKIAETARQVFTGYDVKINSQFGNVSRTGKFEGSTGKPAASVAENKPEDFAEIEMQGAPL